MRNLTIFFFFLILLPGAAIAAPQVEEGGTTPPTHEQVLIDAVHGVENDQLQAQVAEWVKACSANGQFQGVTTLWIVFECQGGTPPWPTQESVAACDGGPGWTPLHAAAAPDYGAAFCYAELVPTAVQVFLPLLMTEAAQD